jgi:hypothetical protein
MTLKDESVIVRYAAWLPYLTADDRDWLRTRHAEVLEIGGLYRPGFEMYLRWSFAAAEAQDPAVALAAAVVAERGDPGEIGYAIQKLDRTASEWEDRYRPSTGIVGRPYPIERNP